MFLIHHVVNILFVIYVRGDYRILGMSIMSQEDETLLVETWEELDECIPIMKSIMHAVYIIFHCVRSRCRLTIIFRVSYCNWHLSILLVQVKTTTTIPGI